ncbi:hypothetical protein [Haloarcula marismortui]|uniref:Uncharacterized protein n=1 Tax=Haloarcula marismortui ATCC 33799 TaxID=662475 RepID=M0KSC3_9EURY|nr:hypothetical protein [Haloarcula californiae]EMA23828.1 hypothetical protein C435_03778 [Haloarcula californiae ATCC 33799]
MPIESYSETTENRKLVIDYCARHAVVPRKSDDSKLPAPWDGVSSEEIQAGIKEEFGRDVSKGMGTLTWEALGARGEKDRGTVKVSGHDVEEPLAFLQERREAILDAGLDRLAEWKE